MPGGIEQNRCPRRPILDDPKGFQDVLLAVANYKDGFLPHPGGINDQSCLFPKYVSIVNAANAHCMEIEREQEEQVAAMNSRSAGGGTSVLRARKLGG